MYFDRYDVCEAYYVFAFQLADNYEERRINSALDRMHYRPGWALRETPEPRYLTENAKGIYMVLVEKHFTPYYWEQKKVEAEQYRLSCQPRY